MKDIQKMQPVSVSKSDKISTTDFATGYLFEVEGITEAQAREAFKLAAYKFPVKCEFIKK